jgi:UDP-N-acetyl-D-mannosaminuronic acid dehydrogenase
MKINVIGLGYVGLPTSILIASSKYRVVGTDINKSLVDSLRDGSHIFYEPEIQRLYAEKKNKYLTFDASIVEADYYIVAVPTPIYNESKKIDLSYICSVLDSLIEQKQEEIKIIIESTIGPSTIDKLSELYKKKTRKKLVFFHAPERILPGNTYFELINNDRIIGADEPLSVSDVRDIYRSFSKGEITLTSNKMAAMSKIMENAYRDLNIAFANEISQVCNQLNLDASLLIELANKHPRVNILSPGPGVGGHCIPIDPWFVIEEFPSLTRLMQSARQVNDLMPRYIINRIIKIIDEYKIDLKKIGFYGLTYKPNVADLRESPSLKVIELFKNHYGKSPLMYDPFVKVSNDEPGNFKDFIDCVDLVIVLVNHSQIYEKVQYLRDKIIFDTRNTGLEIDCIRL